MSRKWWILAAVACGTFMATLDSSIVNIALPTLTKAFGATLYQVKWVVVIYLLVVTCLLLPFGRLSDHYGRKTVFQTGFLIFTVGSFLCGISTSLAGLIGARVIQALGVSMLMANGPAIITAAFPFRERGGALGTLAMVVSCGLLAGPSVGGYLISHFGWRSIFLVNLPVGLAGMALAHKYLHADIRSEEKAPFDWIGSFLQTILLIAFIVIFDPPEFSISGGMPLPVARWVVFLVTIVFAAAFIKVEADAKAPLVDLSLLRIRTFWTANIAGLLMFIAFSTVFVLMPFFLEEVLYLAPHEAGLYMTAIPLTIFVVAPISGRLSDRIGSRWLSVTGTLVATLGLMSMAGVFGKGINEEITPTGVVLSLATMGLAIGLFQSPNNNAIMGSVPPAKLGIASAFLATVRNLGMVTGTGLATSLFAWRQSVSHDFVASMHLTHFVAALVTLAAMGFSFWRGSFSYQTMSEKAEPETSTLTRT